MRLLCTPYTRLANPIKLACVCASRGYMSPFQRPPTLTTSAALVVESDETVDDGLDILQHAFLPGMCVLLVSNIDIIFLLFSLSY